MKDTNYTKADRMSKGRDQATDETRMRKMLDEKMRLRMPCNSIRFQSAEIGA